MKQTLYKKTRPGKASSAGALLSLVSAVGEAAEVPERWAGRQVVVGKRAVPLLGGYETRTDSWVLAEVVRTDDRWEIRQTTCDVRIAEVAGVSVRFDRATLRALPPVNLRLVRNAAGALSAPPWRSGWNDRDLDDDGWPGLTLRIGAPLCSGRLGVTSETWTEAKVRRVGPAVLDLELTVAVEQRITETSGWCLSLADEQTNEQFVGRARYEPLGPAAGCGEVTALPPLEAPAVE